MDDLTRLRLIAMLERDEGRRPRAYRDSRGIWTVGVGHNLESTPFSDHVIDVIRDDDIRAIESELLARVPWVESLGGPRYTVVLDMAFNLGVAGLMTFDRFLTALHEGKWEKAADEMRESLWAQQVGQRATRLERQMVRGEW